MSLYRLGRWGSFSVAQFLRKSIVATVEFGLLFATEWHYSSDLSCQIISLSNVALVLLCFALRCVAVHARNTLSKKICWPIDTKNSGFDYDVIARPSVLPSIRPSFYPCKANVKCHNRQKLIAASLCS